MPGGYLTIAQVAERLQLQIRTIHHYVRSGRLKAVRIGKQYRIAPEDLDKLVGVPAAALPTEAAIDRRHTDIVAIVHIDVIDAEEAGRIATTARYKVDHVQAIYDDERKRLKVILAGDLPSVTEALGVIELLTNPSKLAPPRRLGPARPWR